MAVVESRRARAQEVTILNLKFYCTAGLARSNQGHQRIKRANALKKISFPGSRGGAPTAPSGRKGEVWKVRN